MRPTGSPAAHRSRFRRGLHLVGLAGAAGLGVIGCGSEAVEPIETAAPAVTTTAPEEIVATTTTVPAASDQVASFLSALALRDASLLSTTAADLSPGSPIQLYAQHLALAVEAIGVVETASLTEIDGVFELCAADRCSTFSDPQFDPGTGLLADMAVDGRELEFRLAGAGPVVAIDDAQGRIHSAYLSDSGSVNIVIEVTNTSGQELRLLGFAATQTTPEGRVIQPAGSWGASSIESGSSGRALIVVPDGSLSGTVSVPLVLADSTDLELVLPAVS
jgi:hypothetical protein